MRLEAVEVLVVEREQAAAVLQGEADVARHDLRAEAEVVALDERAAVAVLVDDGQIDRVAVRPASDRRRARRSAAFSRSISLPRRSAYSLEISSATGSLAEGRVGVEPGAVGEGQLLGLDEQVQILGAAEARASCRSYGSSRLSICRAAMPWPLGGSSQTS